jgi:hypothetical protein
LRKEHIFTEAEKNLSEEQTAKVGEQLKDEEGENCIIIR